MKLLVSEEGEAKQTRKFLRSALARLDNETVRAQEAEQRALELAERFKIVNDARLQAQQELQHVNEELRLYKVQYDNAQREISRGQDLLKALEAQRDDAETHAAKARSTARRLKEENLMMRARDEGRRAGYAEGLRRGLQQARIQGLRSDTDGGTDFNTADNGADDAYGTDSLADLPVRNLTSPTISLQSPIPQHPIPPAVLQPGPPGPSRFHEHGIGISPAPASAMLHDEPNPWPDPLPDRPTPVANAPPSPRHQATHDLPLGYIPPLDPDGKIRLPPSHEVEHITPASPQPLHIPPPGTSRNRSDSDASAPSLAGDYGRYAKPQTPSVADSYQSFAASQSTTMSQFDLVNPPSPVQSRGDRRQALSTIQEVSSSADYTPRHSPSIDRTASFERHPPPQDLGGMPEASVFPGVPQVRVESPEDHMRSPPRSRAENMILADSLRYGHPDIAEQMRRGGSEVRSNPSISSLPRHRPTQLTTPAPLAPQPPLGNSYAQPPPSNPYAQPPPGNSYARPPPGNPYPQPPLQAGNPFRPPSVGSTNRGRETPRADLLRPAYTGGSGSQSHRSAPSPNPSSPGIDINIEVIPPSARSSWTSSPQERTQGMLSPDPSVSELPAEEPSQPVVQPVPTVPASPRYQSMGLGPEPSRTPGGSLLKVNQLPPGFVPSAPPSPLPQDSQLQATPRSNPMNLYGPPGAVPLQRSTSSSSSTTGGYPKAMHSRSRSMGQPPSVDSLRSKTPHGRPPSALGSVPPIYGGAPQPPGSYPVPIPPPGGGYPVPIPPSGGNYPVPIRPPSGGYPLPVPPPGGSAADSPRSTFSRKSGHERSRSMYAGSTPAPALSRPLSTAPTPIPDPAHSLRRTASVASDDSGVSGMSRSSRRSFKHYDPRENLEPAYLASAEELPLSPNTQANTMANAARMSAAGPGSRTHSPALSYASLRDDGRY
ncbi:hypothetical protein PsYK624_006230 [Phanerochaete sordida]|uniref:Uncharacterized protein n=1 Tax=Phanerochaete sordida TaxID=48140 RepID=A0A9P3FWT8_9APHY|nr:hypothetical protein PsYK624_006230 [Phanerochaete sordida]